MKDLTPKQAAKRLRKLVPDKYISITFGSHATGTEYYSLYVEDQGHLHNYSTLREKVEEMEKKINASR